MDEITQAYPEKPLEGASAEDLEKAKAGPKLQTMTDSELGKYVRKRWSRYDPQERIRAAELKVNHLRLRGIPYAEIHPNHPDRVFIPPDIRDSIPMTENRIARSCDRYVAQVTADEPLLQAIPAKSEDDDQDKARAATHALRGEYHRMKLNTRLKTIMHVAAVDRSAFRRIYWDPTAGPDRPATLMVPGESGDHEERYIDEEKEFVESEDDAALISDGDLAFVDGTPFQVRYSDGVMFAHDAAELLWGDLITLRELFETYPAAKKLKLEDLTHDTPADARQFLTDLSGRGGRTVGEAEQRNLPEGATVGEDLPEESDYLDTKVFFLIYFLRKNRKYKKGYECHVVGNTAIYRGDLAAWGGAIPVVHYKFLNDLVDKQGRSFVDVTKDAQDLEDFVTGHILRWVQSLKRQFLVHANTTIQGGPQSLDSPHQTAIYWSGQHAPSTQDAGQFPTALTDVKDRINRFFDDQTGLTESARGLHVPGVQSGEHVRQLVIGTETLLGLTRDLMVEALQVEGQLILRGIKHYWKRPRRTAYFGRDKSFVDKMFTGADFGSTDDVLLVKGSLLMLTPAQRSEILAGYAKQGLLTKEEAKLYLPFADTTGVDLYDDPHYLRARRQNEAFLDGPPEELVEAKAAAEQQIADLTAAGGAETFAAEIMALQEFYQELLAQYLPIHLPTEDSPEIAAIHFREHARALARQRTDEFVRDGLDWWVEPFLEHAVQEGQTAGLLPAPQPQPPPTPEEATGAPAGSAPAGVPGAQGPPPPAPAVALA